MLSADEDSYVPITTHLESHSPGAQAQPDDRGSGGVVSDHSGKLGEGAAVLAEAGCDLDSLSDIYWLIVSLALLHRVMAYL